MNIWKKENEDQMKVYSDNGEKYGYYGYDDAGQRMYKVTLNNTLSRINALGDNVLEVEKLMLYPNGYININQNGEYTKHYYADAARIASKIGSGYEASITAGTDSLKMLEALELMQKELGDVTNDTVGIINYSFGQITHLQGDSCKYENALYFYHGNHLSSTQLITDINADLKQAVLYTPWGSIISEYRQDWMLDTIPRFLFNAKELDEESGMYYYSARYYAPPTFISRDPMFEKYPSISPYAYCLNNPVILIDPDGRSPKDPPYNGAGYYAAEVNTRYLGFGLRNPAAAMRIGFGVTRGASNISTNATRFATRGEILNGSKRSQEDRGSENGAFRHVLWQATITSEFDRSVAAQAGNAHEGNPYTNLAVRTFANLDDADQVVDMLNNQIGRNIGDANKGASMNDLAKTVLDEFKTNGLYTASKGDDGNYTISKTKLSSTKYDQLMQIFDGLNSNGRTPAEQKAADIESKQRLEQLQSTWGTMK